jgi:hypothetical protein
MSYDDKLVRYIRTQIIGDYIGKISSKYGIDKKELMDIWEQTSTLKSGGRKDTSPPLPRRHANKKSTATTCPYTFQRGKAKGELCGKVVTNKYKRCCPEHDKLLLRKIKGTTLKLHKATNLVLIDDRVIGKYVGAHVIELTSEDVEICDSWKFQIYIPPKAPPCP